MNISSMGAGQRMARPDPAEFFKKADTDGSGGISKEELATALKDAPQPPGGAGAAPDVDKIFAEVDTDGDGQISESENKTHMENMEKNHGPGGMKGSADQFDKLIEELKKALLDSTDSTESTSSSEETSATTGNSTTTSTDESSTDSSDISDEQLAKFLSQILEKLKQNGDSTSLFSAKA